MEKKRIRSGMRPLISALCVLIYALVFGLGSLFSYIIAALVFFIAWKALKKRYKDRVVVIERAPNSGDSACDALILEGRESLKKIREANDRIPDEALSRRIDSIEESCRQIFQRLEENPSLTGNLRSFLRYYLPATLKVLDARAQLDAGTHSKAAQSVRSRTEDALRMVEEAFKKQLAALDEFRFLNLESEMDVLTDLLKSDGLIDDDAQGGTTHG